MTENIHGVRFSATHRPSPQRFLARPYTSGGTCRPARAGGPVKATLRYVSFQSPAGAAPSAHRRSPPEYNAFHHRATLRVTGK
ncbi:hypothetical protein Ssi02_13350 [Sinosporangium siamense]|uniref:Uncharacterized protein n=1 Tax=Sinosporangium siamense TaxID=1367973 RepID=A0A919RFZ7_9ACTN|nr:hypothetical protein Ssi02_13350 [Sinosporangium siamense]